MTSASVRGSITSCSSLGATSSHNGSVRNGIGRGSPSEGEAEGAAVAGRPGRAHREVAAVGQGDLAWRSGGRGRCRRRRSRRRARSVRRSGSCSSAGMPGPWSVTTTARLGRVDLDGDLDRRARRARTGRRCRRGWRSPAARWARRAGTTAVGGPVTDRSIVRRRGERPRPRRRRRGRRRQVGRPPVDGAGPAAGVDEQLVDRRLQPVRRPPSSAPARAGRPRASARGGPGATSAFVTSTASGVRSSWLVSSISRRWVSAACSRRSSMASKLAASATTSAGPRSSADPAARGPTPSMSSATAAPGRSGAPPARPTTRPGRRRPGRARRRSRSPTASRSVGACCGDPTPSTVVVVSVLGHDDHAEEQQHRQVDGEEAEHREPHPQRPPPGRSRRLLAAGSRRR